MSRRCGGHCKRSVRPWATQWINHFYQRFQTIHLARWIGHRSDERVITGAIQFDPGSEVDELNEGIVCGRIDAKIDGECAKSRGQM